MPLQYARTKNKWPFEKGPCNFFQSSEHKWTSESDVLARMRDALLFHYLWTIAKNIFPNLIWYWLSFSRKNTSYNFFTMQGQKPHKKVVWESVAIKSGGRKIQRKSRKSCLKNVNIYLMSNRNKIQSCQLCQSRFYGCILKLCIAKFRNDIDTMSYFHEIFYK